MTLKMVQISTEAGEATAIRDAQGNVNGVAIWADGSSCTFRWEPLENMEPWRREQAAKIRRRREEVGRECDRVIAE